MVEVSLPIYVLQWVLLGALGLLVLVMYRQLGFLLRLGRATSGHGGLSVGERAQTFEYKLLPRAGQEKDDGSARTFRPGSAPTILAFTDPACGSCESAVHALEKIQPRALKRGIEVLAVIENGESVLIPTYLTQSPLTVAVVAKGVPFRLYETGVTPYLFAVDGAGLIRASGAGDSAREISKLLATLDEARTDATNASRVLRGGEQDGRTAPVFGREGEHLE